MTVIAWDGQTIAADSASRSDLGVINRVCKVGLVEPPRALPHLGELPLVLFGVAGDPAAFHKVYEFLSGSAERLDLEDKAEALICSAGAAWLWSTDRPAVLLNGAVAAIGQGAQGALVAMHAGLDAARAVELVVRVVDSCSGPVQALSLPVPVPVEQVELKEVGQP